MTDTPLPATAPRAIRNPAGHTLPHEAEVGAVEEALLTSGMEYTFLHPTVFFQNVSSSWPRVVKTGVFAEPWSTDTRFSRVDYRGVAEVAAMMGETLGREPRTLRAYLGELANQRLA